MLNQVQHDDGYDDEEYNDLAVPNQVQHDDGYDDGYNDEEYNDLAMLNQVQHDEGDYGKILCQNRRLIPVQNFNNPVYIILTVKV